ncbi:N-acetylglucosamine-1-phosphodiester like protein [Argiope bruennichi]|uniref:N-acetylglucosamine-1-phosphodiester like protein n=1 Tax=Argiope bruennichi TaxID=94029 RepID=A0A8T0F2C1_ARGBR|nr:N-acetylglucosamine-1-phosphodiester like protein [Argiope bruennichi]
MQSLVVFISIFNAIFCPGHGLSSVQNELLEQPLTPYVHKHGSRLTHRSIQECHKEEYGSPPHEVYPAHVNVNLSEPFIQVKRFVKELTNSFPRRTVRGHYVLVSNPLKTLSVLEPDQPGGCSLNIRQTVSATSKKHKCTVAINAGYFDTTSGKCLGNVISNGRIAHDSNGIQNAHFGLTKDGKIFTGYVSEENVLSGNLLQLVGGVIWILRNGTGFVNVSKKLECEKTEETGPMDHFINILSARSAVGHDEDGNVIIVQVDGKSGVDGINLNEMETLLQQLGVVNAINLDGGGSSTLVINGTTAKIPLMACKNNCSNRGICTNEGCICHPGYFGEDCTENCLSGWYGSMCSKQCDCFNSVGCDPISGSCKCKRGFTGEKCLSSCPVGFFGQNCQLNCQCNNTCFCDPVTGDCEVSFNSSIYQAAKCVARNIIQNENLVKDNVGERRKWYLTMVILGIITAVCLASFLLLMFCSCSCSCQNEQILCLRKEGKQKKKYRLQVPSGYLSDSTSDSETVPMQNFEKS